MTYDRWQYRVESKQNSGECPRCGGAFVKDVEPACINCGALYPISMPVDIRQLSDAYDGERLMTRRSSLTPQERRDIIDTANAMRELGSSWDDIAKAVKMNRSTLVNMVRYE